VYQHPSSPAENMRYFLIYGALPMLLIQRGIFLLHGSAVSDGQRALVLLGASLSGKSTLAAGFWQRGWKLISDELVVCTPDPAKGIYIQPGVPQILLWQNAIEQLGLDSSLVSAARVPKQFLLSVGKRFEEKPMPVQIIFHLEKISSGNSDQIELEGRAKFDKLMQDVYLPRFPRPQTFNLEQAKVPLSLINIPSKKMIWTTQQYRVSGLLDKIQEQLSK